MSGRGKRATPAPDGDNLRLAIAIAKWFAWRDGKRPAHEWPKRWSDPTYLGDGPWGA